MEECAMGTVVSSKCGRDRYRVFVIVGELPQYCDKTMVLIADGRLHTLEKPKKKNLRHLRVLATPDGVDTSAFNGGNSELRRLVDEYNRPVNKKS